MKKIAIVGGGIAGVTAAYELAKCGADFTLFESSGHLGGIVETLRRDGFTIECGPDGWVTEKPWARELALELGLSGQIIGSNDDDRRTYVVLGDELVAMPDGMRMMVPTDLAALDHSPLFSESAKQAYRAEIDAAPALRASAPAHDESVASFVRRHFGDEVLAKIGAPLLSGVFGGDVEQLSVRAVMAPFVAMEREHGSLILALQQRMAANAGRTSTVFTSLRDGTGALIDAMLQHIPQERIRLQAPVHTLQKQEDRWLVESPFGTETFDAILLATPVDQAARLLEPTDPLAASLIQMDASSAVVVAFAFQEYLPLPSGFGFLVPPGSAGKDSLLAATFVDQKYSHRAPPGARLLRAFFGGEAGARLMTAPDEQVIQLAFAQLQALLGALPAPSFTVVRRWPRSLPQYAVGHLERMAELDRRVQSLGGLALLGNGYRGVGLPDLIRDARSAACACIEG